MTVPNETFSNLTGGVRDMSWRLFGYPGLLKGEHGFSLDHMFGF